MEQLRQHQLKLQPPEGMLYQQLQGSLSNKLPKEEEQLTALDLHASSKRNIASEQRKQTNSNPNSQNKNKKLFPQKLWELINDDTYNFCLRWSTDGQLVYLDRDEFEDSYLKTEENQFHTHKAISFVRQMNMYGFRKVDDCYYENDNFKRDCEHLLKNMIRKHPAKNLPGSLSSSDTNSITSLPQNNQSHMDCAGQLQSFHKALSDAGVGLNLSGGAHSPEVALDEALLRRAAAISEYHQRELLGAILLAQQRQQLLQQQQVFSDSGDLSVSGRLVEAASGGSSSSSSSSSSNSSIADAASFQALPGDISHENNATNLNNIICALLSLNGILQNQAPPPALENTFLQEQAAPQNPLLNLAKFEKLQQLYQSFLASQQLVGLAGSLASGGALASEQQLPGELPDQPELSRPQAAALKTDRLAEGDSLLLRQQNNSAKSRLTLSGLSQLKLDQQRQLKNRNKLQLQRTGSLRSIIGKNHHQNQNQSTLLSQSRLQFSWRNSRKNL